MERNILIDTLKQYPLELKSFPFEVQDDEELVCIAVKRNGLALQYASERLRNNYEIVMIAVKKNGLALQFASEELKNNGEIVFQAILSAGDALQFVPDALRNNRELILNASRSCRAELIPEQFLADEDIAWNLIKHDYRAFQYLSEELRKDLDLIIEVIQFDVDMLMCVPDEVLNDRAKVLQLVAERAGVLAYAADEFKNDKEIALIAMRADGSPWGYDQLSKALKYDVDVLRELVNNLSLNYSEEFDFINVFNSYHIPVELLADDAFIIRLAEIYDCAEDVLELNKELVIRMIELRVCNTDILDEGILEDADVQSALEQFMSCESEEDED
jgi:hypothetical protein